MEMSTRSENLDMKCKQTIYDTEKVSKQNAKKKGDGHTYVLDATFLGAGL